MAAILAFVAPLAVYAVVNLAYAGAAFPVSGSYKSTLPLPSIGTLNEVLELLRHPLSRHPVWRIYRHAPSLLSIFASIPYLACVVGVRVERRALRFELRSFATSFDAFLVSDDPGIWLIGAYDLAVRHLVRRDRRVVPPGRDALTLSADGAQRHTAWLTPPRPEAGGSRRRPCRRASAASRPSRASSR